MFLAISGTLVVTLAILHWNYVEHKERKMAKKHTILNHWGKQKPVQADLDKLYVEEPAFQQQDPKVGQLRENTETKNWMNEYFTITKTSVGLATSSDQLTMSL